MTDEQRPTLEEWRCDHCVWCDYDRHREAFNWSYESWECRYPRGPIEGCEIPKDFACIYWEKKP